MTRKAKVKDNFTTLKTADKIDYAQLIHDKIKGNLAVFVTPDITMDDFQDHISTLNTLNMSVEGGDHSQIAARDAAVIVINNDLRTLAAYVSRIANGQETIIALAGFTATKTEIAKSQIPAQAVIGGGPGKIIGALTLMVEKLEYAIRYTFIVSEDLSGVEIINGMIKVNTATKPVFTRTSNITTVHFTDLDTRVNYHCICFATSTAGSGIASEAVIVKTS